MDLRPQHPFPQYPYFNLDPKVRTKIDSWLASHQYEYLRLYASFLNYALKLAQPVKDDMNAEKELTINECEVLVVLNNRPLNADDLVDVLEKYLVIHWAKGSQDGYINLDGGRRADEDDIRNAHHLLEKFLSGAE